VGAETDAFETRDVPAPIFILWPRRAPLHPLVGDRAQSLGDEDSFQQIEEALDDQGQR